VLSDWQEWTGCDPLFPTQQYRVRKAQKFASSGGKPCTGKNDENVAMKEVKGCLPKPPTTCVLGNWTDWLPCDKTCDGGQTTRSRQFLAPAANTGSCGTFALTETASCGETPCHTADPGDCQLSQWSIWTDCSITCGNGTRTRERQIKNAATNSGIGCEGVLKDIGNCMITDCIQDCKWGVWERWSDCTKSCGGGFARRTRVIEVNPTLGGKSCSGGDKDQISTCNAAQCPRNCQDGAWTDWGSWAACSASCGTGYTFRSRDVATQPGVCGRPAEGEAQEYKPCPLELPPCVADQDCQPGSWSDWSACSTSCFGIRQRHREIRQYRSGAGKACSMPLQETSACNKKGELPPDCHQVAPPTPCMLDVWSSWSECTATCDSGQESRTRRYLSPAVNDGDPCDDDLEETRPCAVEACPRPPCVNCVWHAWSSWGDCTNAEGLQKYRNRQIKTHANYCGERCTSEEAEQVARCPIPKIKPSFCAWAEWSAYSECTKTCGSSARTRFRNLRRVEADSMDRNLYLFKVSYYVSSNKTCQGHQAEEDSCAGPPCEPKCVPKDCAMGDWTDWLEPKFSGLCERTRVIAQRNNECGKPCKGAGGGAASLTETKQCTSANEKQQDCTLSDWDDWSSCHTEYDQRYSARHITQMPMNDGQGCDLWLQKTESCKDVRVKSVDCELSVWSDWSPCSETCGGGQQWRRRRTLTEVKKLGSPCDDKLEEMRGCNSRKCGSTVDCAWADWGPWSACDSDLQTSRQRDIETHAENGGKPCDGRVEEIQGCDRERVDCLISSWTEWEACSSTCEGGRQLRHRQVHKYPENGGKACPASLNLAEVRGCDKDYPPCDVQHCALNVWEAWGACTTSCGVGAQVRKRSISSFRGSSGIGCNASLEQVRGCVDNPDCGVTDCLWGDWGVWSECSKTCGGGQKIMRRSIQQMPLNGGKACTAEQFEKTEKCNTNVCNAPIDGDWAQWEAWTPCTETCETGVTWRVRKVKREADFGGTPAIGESQQVASCNSNIPCGSRDCLLGDWKEWTSCSSSCDGIRNRTREIKEPRAGKGKSCNGTTTETGPCQPSHANRDDAPKGCIGEIIDCVISDWVTWSICTVTCGGGQRTRARSVTQASMNGGKECKKSLEEMQPCNEEKCLADEPVDCVWGEWRDWSHCTICGGQRTRFREVMTPPKNHGTACVAQDAAETGNCTRKCRERFFCTWDDWGDWSACSRSCDKGRQYRTRELTVQGAEGPDGQALPLGIKGLWTDTSSATAGDLGDKVQELYRQAEGAKAKRVQELVAAFAFGFSSLVAALGVWRVCSAWSRPSSRWPRRCSGGSGLESLRQLLPFEPLTAAPVESGTAEEPELE